MRKFFMIAAGAFVGIILVAVIVLSLIPNEFSVTRQITIAAPPEQIHLYVADLEKWDLWMPWKDGDPTIVVTPGDIRQGVGANQTWTGESGDGRIVLTASDPQTGIAYDFWMNEEPTPSHSTIAYEVVDGEPITTVIWTMEGTITVPVFGGIVAKMMDHLVGPSFDLGLTKLQTVAEEDATDADTDPAPDDAESTDAPVEAAEDAIDAPDTGADDARADDAGM